MDDDCAEFLMELFKNEDEDVPEWIQNKALKILADDITGKAHLRDAVKHG